MIYVPGENSESIYKVNRSIFIEILQPVISIKKEDHIFKTIQEKGAKQPTIGGLRRVM